MQYKVEWMEHISLSSGKKKIKATLVDLNKVEHNDIGIWEEFPGFNAISLGSILEGDIVPSKDQKYKTLYAPRNTGARSFTGQKSGAVAAAETTAKSVKSAQDRNEVMWAKYNATELLTHHPAYRDLSREEIEEEYLAKLTNKIINLSLEPF